MKIKKNLVIAVTLVALFATSIKSVLAAPAIPTPEFSGWLIKKIEQDVESGFKQKYALLGAFVGVGKNVANTEDEKGRLPLHEAARFGHKIAVHLLLERDASVAMQDGRGRTALQCAMEEYESKRIKEQFEVVRALLEHGAEPYEVSNLHLHTYKYTTAVKLINAVILGEYLEILGIKGTALGLDILEYEFIDELQPKISMFGNMVIKRGVDLDKFVYELTGEEKNIFINIVLRIRQKREKHIKPQVADGGASAAAAEIPGYVDAAAAAAAAVPVPGVEHIILSAVSTEAKRAAAEGAQRAAAAAAEAAAQRAVETAAAQRALAQRLAAAAEAQRAAAALQQQQQAAAIVAHGGGGGKKHRPSELRRIERRLAQRAAAAAAAVGGDGGAPADAASLQQQQAAAGGGGGCGLDFLREQLFGTDQR